jgi:hypothetical protein
LVAGAIALALFGAADAVDAAPKHAAKSARPAAPAPVSNRFDLACEQENFINGEPYRPETYHVDLDKNVIFRGDFPNEIPLTVTNDKLSYDRTNIIGGDTFSEKLDIDRTTGSGEAVTRIIGGQFAGGMPDILRLHCKKQEYSGPGGSAKF